MARTSDGRRRVPVVAGGSRLLVALSLLLGVALISALLPIVIAGSAAVPDSLKAYYTDLEPPAFRAPRRLAYANLFDDESNTFFTVAGKSIAPSELSGSDYPLVTSVVELSEVDGDNGGQAPKSSTPYATAFRVSATVYVAPNKTADPYSSVTVLMWFEEGDVRSFVRVSYTDDDGNEALVDFKNPNTGAPFAKSQTTLKLKVDSTGSVVIHIPAVAGYLSCPPLAFIVGTDTSAVFIIYPDQHILEILSQPASYSRAGVSPLVDASTANSIASTVNTIADTSDDTLALAICKAVEAAKARHRLLARTITDPVQQFHELLEDANTHILARRAEQELAAKKERRHQRKLRREAQEQALRQEGSFFRLRRLGRRGVGKWVKDKAKQGGDAIKKGADGAGKVIDKGTDAISKGVKSVSHAIEAGIDLGEDFVQDPGATFKYAVAKGAPILSSTLKDVMGGVKTAYYILPQDFRVVASKAVFKSVQYGTVAMGGMGDGFAVFIKIADEIYSTTVKSMHQAFRAVEGAFASLVDSLDKVLDYIKTFLLDALKALFKNAQTIAGYFGEAPKFVKRATQLGVDLVQDKTDDIADQVENTITKNAKTLSKQVSGLGLTFPKSADFLGGLSSVASYVMHIITKGLGVAMKAVGSVIDSAISDMVAKFGKLIGEFINSIPCADQMKDAVSAFTSVMKSAGPDISVMIAAVGQLIGTIAGGVITCVADLVDIIGDLVDPILSLLSSILNFKVKLPVVTTAWKLITGLDLSFSSIFGIIGSAIWTATTMAVNKGKAVALPSIGDGNALAAAMFNVRSSSRLAERGSNHDWAVSLGVTGLFKSLLNVVNAIFMGLKAYGKPVFVTTKAENIWTGVVAFFSVPLATMMARTGTSVGVMALLTWMYNIVFLIGDVFQRAQKEAGKLTEATQQKWFSFNKGAHLVLLGGSCLDAIGWGTADGLKPGDITAGCIESVAGIMDSWRIGDHDPPTQGEMEAGGVIEGIGAVVEFGIGVYEIQRAAQILSQE